MTTDPAAIAARRFTEAETFAFNLDETEVSKAVFDRAQETAAALYKELACTEPTTLAGLREQAAVLARSISYECKDYDGRINRDELVPDDRLALTICDAIERLLGERDR